MKSMPVSSRINHQKYGLGVISEIDPQYTTIEFDNHGKKKFVTDIVSLESSEEPPPKRRRGGRKKATTKAATKKTATKKTATKTAKS